MLRRLVKQLYDLQELELVLRETRIVHRDTPPDTVRDTQERVHGLRSKIPDNVLRRFDALLKTSPAVGNEVAGVCSACQMNVPVGDLNRMRRGAIPCVCPNCGRYLLLSERPEKGPSGND